MKTALITGKTDVLKFSPLFEKLQDLLRQCGWDSFIVPRVYPPKKPFDMVFCIGGDGSFLSAARTLGHFGKPIIIIYAGRLGFLPSLHPEELTLENISALLHEDVSWMNRLMLQGSCSQGKKLTALNEFYFTNDQKSSLSEYLIKINGSPVLKVRADGVMVCTPTGSTAYNLSAGGPILMPSLQAMVITPVCSHILGERPFVVGINDCVEIINHNTRPSQIWADGQDMYSLDPEEPFFILPPLNVLCQKTDTQHFFSTLSQKLGWNLRQDTLC